MSWLIDLGNTRLKWARLDAAGALVDRGALAHADAGFEVALETALAGLPHARTAHLASVAGADLHARVQAIVRRVGVEPQPVVVRADFAGLRIAYAEPARLGVDRFLALLGAHARGAGPWLLASVGTALTIDALHAGVHLGGLIAPSPGLMRAALATRVAQLPAHGGAVREFATDTDDALASGCVLAAAALLQHSAASAQRRYGTQPTLLLSGGGADALLPHLAMPAQLAPDLVLEGLAGWARRIDA